MHRGDTRSQDAVLAFLSDPATHGAAVERLSTHGAQIFLAGDKAYKLKRAVAYPFMDFSTVEKRRAALEAELALNKRTAPALYLGLAPIGQQPDGTLRIGAGHPVDWVLVMRRFDQESLLSAVAERKELTPAIVDALADRIVSAHRDAPVVDRDEVGYFTTTALDNVAALRDAGLASPAVDALEQKLRTACGQNAAHLTARTRDGFVRRCHGDLHLANIVLLGGRPTLFDALEFDPALAMGDVFYDLAFLLMDLEHHGLRPLAQRLLNRYVVLTDDFEGLTALALFLATRAAVRAKVAALRADADGARAYVALANGYLPAPAPRLIAIGGLSGTGKSTIARLLAPDLEPAPGAIVIRSDVIRKRLFGVAETARLPQNAYSAETTAAVYGTMLAQASRALRAGSSVILDAVHAQAGERDAVAALARTVAVRCDAVWLKTPLDQRLARIDRRIADASDANAAIVRKQEHYDLGAMNWAVVTAEGSPESLAAACRKSLGVN